MTGQFAAVDDELTGRENLRLFGALRGLGRSAADERATELLGRFDLVAAGDQRVKAYSGGMRRRLDIAASLVVLPEVLFLDEPTTGLDPRSRSALWAVVRELRAGGMAIVLTTQYLEEADQLADRIVLIDHGRLIASGTPAELKGLIGGVSCVIEIVNPQDLDRAAMIIASVGEPHVDTEACTVSVAGVDGSLTMTTVLSSLEAAGIAIGDAGLKRPSLDDVYLTLTGQVTP